MLQKSQQVLQFFYRWPSENNTNLAYIAPEKAACATDHGLAARSCATSQPYISALCFETQKRNYIQRSARSQANSLLVRNSSVQIRQRSVKLQVLMTLKSKERSTSVHLSESSERISLQDGAFPILLRARLRRSTSLHKINRAWAPL